MSVAVVVYLCLRLVICEKRVNIKQHCYAVIMSTSIIWYTEQCSTYFYIWSNLSI